MAYTAGRGWIEYMRIDAVEANDMFGLRLNVWTSIVVFLLATAYFVIVGRSHTGREETVFRDGAVPATGRRDDGDRETDDGQARAPSRPRGRAPGQVSLPFGESPGRHR